MKKKNILIVSHSMRIGGAERSLLGLINVIDYSKYNVDLFLFIHDGEWMNLIPKEVNLLPENKKYASLLCPVKEIMKRGHVDILLGKTRGRIQAAVFCKKNKLGKQNLVYSNYLQKYTLPFLPPINDKEYDLGISFLTPHYIIPERANCRKKIAWIHTDYSFYEFDKKTETDMWRKYDFIASVSDGCSESFNKTLPGLEDKVMVIENIFSPDFIKKQAEIEDIEKEIPKKENTTIICSVGRFSHAKNFENIPFICKYLLNMGKNVMWYLIGTGEDEALIRSKIEETNMQNYVIILGKKENPYPYIKACDIYVQPSRFEGKAVTVREAQVLTKPVVITDFSTSASQLRNGVDGMIVPQNNEHCAKGINLLIDNMQLQYKLINNCKKTDYGNEKEVEKIYALI